MTTVKNTTISLEREVIMDDLTNKDENAVAAEQVDMEKLAALKAKIEAKREKEKETAMLKQDKPAEKVPSVRLGILGSGQAGGRLCEVFYSYNTDIVCLNTAQVDLDNIKVPESNKLLLDNNVGGSAKSLELGEQAAVIHADKIRKAINTHLADAEVLVLATSLGGGSGAGSLPVLVDLLGETGKPIVAMVVLPKTSDDGLSKNNALITLNKLSKLTQNKKVSSIICIDNAKIEQIYNDVSPLNFFQVANREVVSMFHNMNCLANSVGIDKTIDKMEWLKLMLDGEGFSIYGSLKVEQYSGELDLAEALLANVEANLLSGSFDIKQAKYAGVFISANEKVWSKLSNVTLDYCMSCINSEFDAPLGVFKGTYKDNSIEGDYVLVHFFYSGLGLPMPKINALKSEVEKLNAMIKDKAANRSVSLEFDLGGDKVLSKADEVKSKIAAKNSNFGKFISNTIDRRNK